MADFRSFGAGVAGTFNQVSYGDDNGGGSAKPQPRTSLPSASSSYFRRRTSGSSHRLLPPPPVAQLALGTIEEESSSLVAREGSGATSDAGGTAERAHVAPAYDDMAPPQQAFEFEQAVYAFASHFGLRPDKYPSLLWIPEAALRAPVPLPWQTHIDGDGRTFFYDPDANVSSWDHPLDEYFRELTRLAKKVYREASKSPSSLSKASSSTDRVRSLADLSLCTPPTPEKPSLSGRGDGGHTAAGAGVLMPQPPRGQRPQARRPSLNGGGDESLVAGEGASGSELLDERSVALMQKKLNSSEAEVSKLKQQLLQQQLALHTREHEQQQQHAAVNSALQQQLSSSQSQVAALAASLSTQKQLHADLSATLQHELRHQQQQQQELIRSRSERDTAREEAAAAAKDVISLRALLQVAQLRQTERENASKEILVDSFEVERGRLAASLSDKVAECSRLNERLASSQQQLADLQALREVDTLEMETRQVSDLRSQVASLMQRLGEERTRADREADAAARLRDEFAVAKLQEQQAASRQAGMVDRNEKLQGEMSALQGQLQLVELQFGEQQKLMALQQTQQQQHQQLQQHHSEELKSLRIQRDTWEAEARRSKSAVSELVAANARLQSRVASLHNEIIDLKGAIRVFVRIRPMNSGAEAQGPSSAVVSPAPSTDGDGACVRVSSGTAKQKEFMFDHVLGEDDGQDAVWDSVQPLLTSVTHGYNICVFAYGQTGSGKTHTVLGSADDHGIVQRTLSALMQWKNETAQLADADVSLSMLELYNETLRDLLVSDVASPKKLDLQHDSHGGVRVTNLSVYDLSSAAHGLSLVEAGCRARSVGATNMNAHSSRSHLIISISVRSRNKFTGATKSSKMYIVDLAGSEDISKSGAEGVRRVEALSINKSLSALHDVMIALAAKQKHIPYRNSKLTHTLSDALGGQAKTLMFVMISPSELQLRESLASLAFGTRCKSVALGHVSANVGHSGGMSQPLPLPRPVQLAAAYDHAGSDDEIENSSVDGELEDEEDDA